MKTSNYFDERKCLYTKYKGRLIRNGDNREEILHPVKFVQCQRPGCDLTAHVHTGFAVIQELE